MMPENEPRREQDVENLRALAYRQEAVREDLVRYFQEGVGVGEILSTLRPVVREALDKILKEALTDERFQERLGRHVADRVLAGVTKELQVAQVAILQQVSARRFLQSVKGGYLLGAARCPAAPSEVERSRIWSKDRSVKVEVVAAGDFVWPCW